MRAGLLACLHPPRSRGASTSPGLHHWCAGRRSRVGPFREPLRAASKTRTLRTLRTLWRARKQRPALCMASQCAHPRVAVWGLLRGAWQTAVSPPGALAGSAFCAVTNRLEQEHGARQGEGRARARTADAVRRQRVVTERVPHCASATRLLEPTIPPRDMQALRHLAHAGRHAAATALSAAPAAAFAAARSTLAGPSLTPQRAPQPPGCHARALSSPAGPELEQLPEAVRRMLSLDNASQVPAAGCALLAAPAGREGHTVSGRRVGSFRVRAGVQKCPPRHSVRLPRGTF